MLVFKVPWRNLLRNKRRTIITVFAIATGVAFSVFFFAMTAGVEKKTVADATRMLAGNITVEDPHYRDAPAPNLFVHSIAKVSEVAAKIPEVLSVKPLCTGTGVVASAAGSVGVGFFGVQPEQERELSLIARSIVSGRFIASSDADVKGVVVGTRLAQRLQVDIGKKLVLTTTSAQGEIVQELLRVVGVFKVGTEAMDGQFIEMPIAVARKVMGLTADQATQVGLVLERPESQDVVLALTKRALANEGVAVYPWQTLLPAIATWVTAGHKSHQITCGVILFLTTFTILNTILMSVLERKREFAMLLALGTAPRLLRMQVFVETLILGFFGIVSGLGLGGLAAGLAQRHGLDLSKTVKEGEGPTVGNMALDLHLRPELTVRDALFVAGFVLLMTALIAIYPTLRSSRVDVANTLRSQ
jgi:ABC-type lipoprotein release transport system permease subunit